MILDHVAQAAALLIVARACTNAAVLGHGDLHMLDEIPVPQGFEDRIGKPLDEEVLHGLLAEIMVDAEHLRLLKDAGDHAVEFMRRGQIAPERLLDHNL